MTDKTIKPTTYADGIARIGRAMYEADNPTGKPFLELNKDAQHVWLDRAIPVVRQLLDRGALIAVEATQ